MPDGRFRVLLFGDSFSASDRVRNRLRFGDLLEERFPEVEIPNSGLARHGDRPAVLGVSAARDNLAYDLLLVCHLVENIRRVVSRDRLTTSLEGEPSEFVASRSPLAALVPALRRARPCHRIPAAVSGTYRACPRDGVGSAAPVLGGTLRLIADLRREVLPSEPTIQSPFRKRT